MFEIENSQDKLKVLELDYKKLIQDPLNISLAEKACSDAWHLADWVFEEKREVNNLLTKQNFRENLFLNCPEMRILHDISNCIKHKVLSRPKAQIKETKKHGGSFSSSFSKDFDVSRLEVYLDDGSKIDVDSLLKISIEYWKNET